MKLAKDLASSRSRLQNSGQRFFSQTTAFTKEFGEQARDSFLAFTEDTAGAAQQWWAESVTASASLAEDVRGEAKKLATALSSQGRLLTAEAKERTELVQSQARSISLASSPAMVEKWILEAAKKAVAKVEARIDSRLKKTTATPVKSEESRPKAKVRRGILSVRAPGRVTQRSSAPSDAEPIRNYDLLTARDVVARLQRLSDQKADAVLRYEKSTKKRTTVIRAAQSRIAASA